MGAQLRAYRPRAASPLQVAERAAVRASDEALARREADHADKVPPREHPEAGAARRRLRCREELQRGEGDVVGTGKLGPRLHAIVAIVSLSHRQLRLVELGLAAPELAGRGLEAHSVTAQAHSTAVLQHHGMASGAASVLAAAPSWGGGAPGRHAEFCKDAARALQP